MNFRRSVFLLLILLAFSEIGRADVIPLDSVPRAVMDIVNQEKGDGVVVSAETFDWGSMSVYKIVVELKGIPDMELQISETGKLIRIDHLQEKPDEDPDPDEDFALARNPRQGLCRVIQCPMALEYAIFFMSVIDPAEGKAKNRRILEMADGGRAGVFF